MRSAKLVDAAYRFICECRICDRSLNGLRLALARNIRIAAAHVGAYRRNRRSARREGRLAARLVIGVRLHDRAPATALKPWDRYALRERYYGILD